ncbi:hypothetical protein GWK08_07880 [Leptobacterium flavescens]|uniref:Thioredoxin domain-containing protein n=1 Tax=Leptobacterium flavescens TaxID=472055 RepID=A0A6P0ULG3_9FLAO|nr:thioredoxin-like domain-containing protein [Leptobacterium flavescens]NER13352.1 hypothetical protein [Leptobacterium flavescens]
MRYLLLAFFTLIACSCTSEKTSSVAYFGGEIINPNDSYVVLYKNDEVIDSVELDENNRFFIQLEEGYKEGLYHFVHRPEEQYVLIEKGDSILIRLNTLDFDESLVFTGRGAEKNNFLIDMFLVNEDEEQLVHDYFALEPKEFDKKMDSLRGMKMEQYENLVSNFELSKNAKDIAKASINFPYYDNKEVYPHMHRKTKGLKEIEEIPAGFYDYRKELNYNDSRLSYFRPYLNYLSMHFSNMSYESCMEKCAEEPSVPERSLHFHTHKLKLIDSLVKKEEVRDNLLRNTAYTYLLQDHDNPAGSKEFITTFNTFSEECKFKEDVNNLYTSIQKLQPGNSLPEIALVKPDSSLSSISSELSGENTVFYFWSINQKNHMKRINKKVKSLRKKYPELRFVGININESQERWLHSLKMLGLETENQYRCANFNEISRKFVIRNLNKIIIVNPDGTIIDAFSNIYRSSDFKKVLKTI